MPVSFDADLSRLLAELEIPSQTQKFLACLGGKNLLDFALALETGDLLRDILVAHGTAKIPATKLIKAIEKVR